MMPRPYGNQDYAHISRMREGVANILEILKGESCNKRATSIMGYEGFFARPPWGWGWKINGITYVSHSENSETVNRKAR